ncbi:Dbl homology domain-containing protein [Mycotypha africana]|uniref:rho guanine nucleotide exchange factor n=1 Tax=Mycotypha africana TaxID=64632 RepID=UPI0023005EB3|nr:rho guanine nucleotide exchange factor [Mycotypha africana]KAI8992052.1 Dbl homology domain-containing protein [Mycotypha africana]
MTTNLADLQNEIYSYDLWRQQSITSAKSYATSSSEKESLKSYDSSEKDPYFLVRSPAYFDSYDTNYLSQLLDDLSIIDEVYQAFNDETDTGPYETQFVNAAKNVAQKQFIIQQMCLTEDKYIIDLENFLFYYLEPIEHWICESSQNHDIFHKYSDVCSKQSLIDQFEITKDITKAQEVFYRGSKERLEMWGPTQFISDIFAEFYDKLSAYRRYVDNFPSVILTLDILYKRSTSFCKMIDECASKTQSTNLKDFFTYLKLPMQKFSQYEPYINQLVQATEAAHPDYRSLVKIQEKYTEIVKQMEQAIADRISHLRVLEVSRFIHDVPIHVSPTRRLYISGLLTKVDQSNPHSLTDTRTYFLYSDALIYCQKIKVTSHQDAITTTSPTKLHYKGSIRLKKAEIMPLSPKTVAKITSEVKKPFAFRIRKASLETKPTSEQRQNSIAATTPTVYGFEICTCEYFVEGGGAGLWSDNTIALHHNGSGSTKRVYTMRTRTEAEQNAWIGLLRRTINNLSIKK